MKKQKHKHIILNDIMWGNMELRGFGKYLLFSLIVIVGFAYIYNLIPSRIDRNYQCRIVYVDSYDREDRINIEVRGKIKKGFFSLKSFTGTIKYGEETFICNKNKFKDNCIKLKNKESIIVIKLSMNERNIRVIELGENLRIKRKIIANIEGNKDKFIKEYYDFIKKLK